MNTCRVDVSTGAMSASAGSETAEPLDRGVDPAEADIAPVERSADDLLEPIIPALWVWVDSPPVSNGGRTGRSTGPTCRRVLGRRRTASGRIAAAVPAVASRPAVGLNCAPLVWGQR
jgi:hypothetical protein